MKMVRLHIAVLQRAGGRRQRLEERLRAELAQHRNIRLDLMKHVHEAQRCRESIDAQLQEYRLRASEMTSGLAPFSIDALTAVRRHTETLSMEHSQACNSVTQAEKAVLENDADIVRVSSAIARCRSRIDFCAQRVIKLQKLLETLDADGQDEESEELAMARRFAR